MIVRFRFSLLWHCLKYVSVEPSYLLHCVAFTMVEFGNMNMYLQKACRFNATAEPDLSTPCDDNEKGVIFVANVNSYVHSVKMFLVTIFIIIYSSWSDQAGRKRKIILVMATASIMLESGFEFLHSYWWSLPPEYAAITSAGLQIIFGHAFTMSSFGFMYLSDVVDHKHRTMRLGIFSSVKFIGILVGKGVSGFLLHAVGFCRYYSICFVISLLSFILAYICIVDTSVPAEKTISPCSAHVLANLRKSFKIILGRGNAKQKITVYLLLVVFSLMMFIHEGEFTVIYLYLKYRFDWNEVMYGIFLFYGCVGIIAGTLFSSVILSMILELHDGFIGIIAALWEAAIAICYVFAFKTWQIYLGHLFAVKHSFSLLIPFCHPIYNMIFQLTLRTFPTAIYFISFGLYIVAAIMYSIVYILQKPKAKEDIGIYHISRTDDKLKIETEKT